MIDASLVSDGYHTIDELHRHRAALFAALVSVFKDKAWKSKKHSNGTMFDNMFVVGIQTPYGQITYHYDIDPHWDDFDCKELEFAPEWDGHTSEDVIDRLNKLRPLIAPGDFSLQAHWIEESVIWRTRRKYVCSNCSSYVTGRFANNSVESIHQVCHTCGAKMIGKTVELPRDENGFIVS